MTDAALPGDQRIFVSNAADRPLPAGRCSSHDRSVGVERSGAGTVSVLIPARIRSLGSEKPWIGAPATMSVASATTSGVASAVESARAPGARPPARGPAPAGGGARGGGGERGGGGGGAPRRGGAPAPAVRATRSSEGAAAERIPRRRRSVELAGGIGRRVVGPDRTRVPPDPRAGMRQRPTARLADRAPRPMDLGQLPDDLRPSERRAFGGLHGSWTLLHGALPAPYSTLLTTNSSRQRSCWSSGDSR